MKWFGGNSRELPNILTTFPCRVLYRRFGSVADEVACTILGPKGKGSNRHLCMPDNEAFGWIYEHPDRRPDVDVLLKACNMTVIATTRFWWTEETDTLQPLVLDANFLLRSVMIGESFYEKELIEYAKKNF